MKEFDYEKAKAGAPICTRDGRPARIICWDADITYKGHKYPIVAITPTGDENYPNQLESYDEGGTCAYPVKSPKDLMMAPTKQEGWLYLYHDGPEVCTSHCVFRTKEDASKAAREIVRDGETQIIKIEWEE